jgi:hypothetical protein
MDELSLEVMEALGTSLLRSACESSLVHELKMRGLKVEPRLSLCQKGVLIFLRLTIST